MTVVVFTLVSALANAAEEVVLLQTSRGVVQPYLLSFEAEQKYTVAAILFTGGYGRLGLRERVPQPGANFLVRSRALFVKNNVATIVVDVPSDRNDMSDSFRLSREHADDIAAVAADIHKRLPDARIFLIGTSRGTISAASVGARLGDRVAGVALTSTLFVSARAGPGLSGFDYASIQGPLLFVHHRQDQCAQTPYESAQRLSSRYALISVSDGDPPRSGACDPFHYHGYLGREEAVVDAISAWMLGKEFPREIR